MEKHLYYPGIEPVQTFLLEPTEHPDFRIYYRYYGFFLPVGPTTL